MNKLLKDLSQFKTLPDTEENTFSLNKVYDKTGFSDTVVYTNQDNSIEPEENVIPRKSKNEERLELISRKYAEGKCSAEILARLEILERETDIELLPLIEEVNNCLDEHEKKLAYYMRIINS